MATGLAVELTAFLSNHESNVLAVTPPNQATSITYYYCYFTSHVHNVCINL